MCCQVSPVGYLGFGPSGDQDGHICEEQGMLGGADMADTDEESGYSNLSQERRRCVYSCSTLLHLFKMSFSQSSTKGVSMLMTLSGR